VSWILDATSWGSQKKDNEQREKKDSKRRGGKKGWKLDSETQRGGTIQHPGCKGRIVQQLTSRLKEEGKEGGQGARGVLGGE